MIFKLVFLLFFSFGNSIIGYKDIPWGTDMSEVVSKIGEAKKNESSCSAIYKGTSASYKLIKSEEGFFPGSILDDVMCKGSFEKDCMLAKRYKSVAGKDGCAIFFDGKFAAFKMTIFKSVAPPEDVLKNLVEKYGNFRETGKANGRKQHGTYYMWRMPESTIIGFDVKGRNWDYFEVFYLSKKQREIAKSALEIKIKDEEKALNKKVEQKKKSKIDAL
jgi:hypothetical protein